MKKCILISFGGRKDGNCSTVLSYIKREFLNYDIEFELMDTLNLSINPCGDCNYRCFNDKCSKNDDVQMLYEKLIKSDLIFMTIPVYGNHLCSKYFAFNERGQDIWKDDENYKAFLRKVFLIGIGNINNSNLFKDELNLVFDEYKIKNHTLVLSSCDYRLSSIRDRLVDNSECLDKISNFAKKVLKDDI